MAVDVKSIYEVPITLHAEKIDQRIFDYFGLKNKKLDLYKWKNFNKKVKNINKQVSLAIVGKYLNLTESYKSLYEAIFHSSVYNNANVKVDWIDAVKIKDQDSCRKYLSNFNGILVPGGFGKRGVDGKILSINYAKNNQKPFLGICFGMQLAVIEAIRSVKGFEKSTSSEFSKRNNNVISFMDEWVDEKSIHKQDTKNYGGSMRLGSYDAILKKGSKIYSIYKKVKISERHRHRYEVNFNYKKIIESNGIVFSGISPDGKLAEVMEYNDHPWFIGVQYHPELKSTPFNPHPLFNSFVNALINNKKKDE